MWSQVLKRTKLPIASNKCTATEGEFLINPQLQYCAGGKTGNSYQSVSHIFVGN